MASYNRVILMGNLTRDPEYKQLASGQAVCRLSIASNRQFKNKQTGSMVQEVCFIDVDVWGPQAESSRQYLSKGRSVLIEGRIKMDTWQETDGNKRTKHSIVADRVTFIASGSSIDDHAEGADGNDDFSGLEQHATAQKGMSKAEDAAVVAARTTKKTTRVVSMDTNNTMLKTAANGEITLKNDGPFEDDLPF